MFMDDSDSDIEFEPNYPLDFDPEYRGVLLETPTIAKECLGFGPYGTLKDYRSAVMTDLGPYAKEVSVSTFLDKFAPPLAPGISEDAVLRDLSDGPSPAIIGDQWTAFKISPRSDLRHEDHAYEPLASAMKAIITAPSLAAQPKYAVEFVQFPNSTPKSTFRDTSMKPDGCGYIPVYTAEGVKVGEPTDVHWYQIIYVAEFKKSDKLIDKRNDVSNFYYSSISSSALMLE